MTLPTTPGSVIRFLVPQENVQEGDEPALWYVATLIPGHIDDDGTAHALVWASSYVNDPEDEGNVFSEEFILSHKVEVIVETVPATPENAEFVSATRDSGFSVIGLVLRVWNDFDDIWETFTYAPGFQSLSGELDDCMFTNSYGGFISHADIESHKHEFLFVPTKLV